MYRKLKPNAIEGPHHLKKAKVNVVYLVLNNTAGIY